MAIVFDSVSTNTGTAADTDVSHTIGAGSDRMMVAVVNMESSAGSTINSCTIDPGGLNIFMLLLAAADNIPGFVNRCYLFIAKEADLPAAGTYTVRANCTLGTSPGVTVCVTTWTGVDQATPSGAQISTNTANSSTTVTTTPTVATANSLSVTGVSCGIMTTMTQPTGYTERQDSTIGTMTGAYADLIESAGAKSLTWTAASSANRLAAVAVVFAEAGAPPSGIIPLLMYYYRRRRI